jgi:hypothetical protein
MNKSNFSKANDKAQFGPYTPLVFGNDFEIMVFFNLNFFKIKKIILKKLKKHIILIYF